MTNDESAAPTERSRLRQWAWTLVFMAFPAAGATIWFFGSKIELAEHDPIGYSTIGALLFGLWAIGAFLEHSPLTRGVYDE